jgi:hypothetical protein
VHVFHLSLSLSLTLSLLFSTPLPPLLTPSPVLEMTTLLSLTVSKRPLKIGQWVRLRRGVLKVRRKERWENKRDEKRRGRRRIEMRIGRKEKERRKKEKGRRGGEERREEEWEEKERRGE